MSFLKPGGRLLISDYCRAEGEASSGFAAYIKQRGYDLHSVAAYSTMLEAAGFESVAGEDRTWQVLPKLCRGVASQMLVEIPQAWAALVAVAGRVWQLVQPGSGLRLYVLMAVHGLDRMLVSTACLQFCAAWPAALAGW